MRLPWHLDINHQIIICKLSCIQTVAFAIVVKVTLRSCTRDKVIGYVIVIMEFCLSRWMNLNSKNVILISEELLETNKCRLCCTVLVEWILFPLSYPQILCLIHHVRHTIRAIKLAGNILNLRFVNKLINDNEEIKICMCLQAYPVS